MTDIKKDMDEATQCESLGKYIPPKMWKDLSVEEKLERIRQEVKNAQSQACNGINAAEQLKWDFSNHDHLNGKVVKDVKIMNNYGLGGVAKFANSREKEASGEVYF